MEGNFLELLFPGPCEGIDKLISPTVLVLNALMGGTGREVEYRRKLSRERSRAAGSDFAVVFGPSS